MNQNTHQRTILETILARHDVVICYNGIPNPIDDEENFVQITASTYRTRKKKSLAEIDCLVKRIRDTYTQSMVDNTKIELIYADNDRFETILILPT
jgi:hypothetical protein